MEQRIKLKSSKNYEKQSKKIKIKQHEEYEAVIR